ncbi:hypothetical protein KAR10_04290 [bacterium]|nr:hypothetical protein [bacterium]
MKKMIIALIVILFIGLFLAGVKILGLFSKGEEAPAKAQTEKQLEVKFYRWDKETNQPGKLIGWAKLQDSKLTYEANDLRLGKMLKGNYHTVVGDQEESAKEKVVVYRAGTTEHLKQVIKNCEMIGCKGILQKDAAD